MEKDDLGIEMDDEVASFMKDPKSGLLQKVLSHHDKRKAKQAELDAAEALKNAPAKEKLFGIF